MIEEGKVAELAALARIEVPQERLAGLAREFGGIVAYIDQLQRLPGAADAAPAVPPLRNVFREDADPTPSGTWTEAAVAAFPQAEGNALSVRKIIAHD